MRISAALTPDLSEDQTYGRTSRKSSLKSQELRYWIHQDSERADAASAHKFEFSAMGLLRDRSKSSFLSVSFDGTRAVG